MASTSAFPTSSRGKNWSEADSMLLIATYQNALADKPGMIQICLKANTLEGEGLAVFHDRLAVKFLASSPQVSSRSSTSIQERWTKMTATYR
jgi:hypothetical protein